jgi:hypothetical protein
MILFFRKNDEKCHQKNLEIMEIKKIPRKKYEKNIKNLTIFNRYFFFQL